MKEGHGARNTWSSGTHAARAAVPASRLVDITGGILLVVLLLIVGLLGLLRDGSGG